MPTPLEAEIAALLHAHKDPVLVADELVARWRRNILSEPEQTDCAQFLLASGLHKVLFAEIQRLINQGARLPWAQFADALGRSGLKLDDFEIQSLLDCASLQNAVPELLRSRQLDLQSRTFAERREELREKQRSTLSDKKQALLDKLEFMRAQRMFEQEAQIIDEFQALFPGESEIKTERDAFQLRWAREVVSNSMAASDPTSELQWKSERLTPEQIEVKNLIVSRSLELIKAEPRLAYDLAIGLHMMDLNSEALDILTSAPQAFATDWLRLELLIRARKFAHALEESSRLESLYANEPDAAFTAVYARARALHGLGQHSMAIELLRTLVRIRPNYKSAQSLLMDWAGSEA